MSGDLPVSDHHWKDLPDIDINDYLGFIYCIEDTHDNKYYFGRKQFWNKRGKRWVDSNWRSYRGSSESLTDQIKRLGDDFFTYRILAVFKTKTGMSLGESIAITCSGSLEEPDRFYNRAAPSIRGRLRVTDEDAQELRRLREWLVTNILSK